jgi:hypothetical protein
LSSLGSKNTIIFSFIDVGCSSLPSSFSLTFFLHHFALSFNQLILLNELIHGLEVQGNWKEGIEASIGIKLPNP